MIPVPENVGEMIDEYLERFDSENEKNEFLFVSRIKKQITSAAIHDVINRIGEECKIENLSVSSMRYACIYESIKVNPLFGKSSQINSNLNLNPKIYSKQKVTL